MTWFAVATVIALSCILLSPLIVFLALGEIKLHQLPDLLIPVYLQEASLSTPLEVVRWSLYAGLSWMGWWACRVTSRSWANFLGYLVRHQKADRPDPGDGGGLSGTLIGCLALCVAIRDQLASLTFFVAHWFLVYLLFPYEGSGNLWLHRTSPKYLKAIQSHSWPFYMERIGGLWVLVVALLVTLEKALLHVIVTGFHRTVYEERVLQSMRALWLVKSLQRIDTAGSQSKAMAAEPSLWRPRPLPTFRKDDAVPAFLLENSMVKKSFKPDDKRLASLFKFLSDGHETISKASLRPFISEPCLKEAWNLLSPLEERLDYDAFRRALGAIYEERHGLVEALKESGDLVQRLDQILFIFVVIGAIFLLFPCIAYGPILPIGISVTPLVVILTINFADTIRSITAALVFIFATHPFDVGDLVYMNGSTFVVRRLRLLSTQLTRWDGIVITYPNALLASMPICNVRRTGPQSVRFEVNLSLDQTKPDQLTTLQSRLTSWTASEGSDDFVDLQAILFELRPSHLRDQLATGNRLVMVLRLRLRQSFQEPAKRSERFNRFWMHAKEVMEELGLTYEAPIILLDHNE